MRGLLFSETLLPLCVRGDVLLETPEAKKNKKMMDSNRDNTCLKRCSSRTGFSNGRDVYEFCK